MILLPTNLEGEYPDDQGDPSVRLHQEHHDAIHAAVNAFLPTVVKTSDEWTKTDLVLKAGQFGVASDTGEARPGNGTRPWAALPVPVNGKVSEGTLALNLRKQPGVVGDGVTDDAAAINRAAGAAAQLGLRLFGTGAFRTDATVVLACDTDLSGATFNYRGSGVAVQLGGSSVLFRKTMILPTVTCATKTRYGWTRGTVGVKAINLNTCFVTITRIWGFETGFYAYGQGSGTAYCTITVGHLDTNKRNLVLGADSGGWSNQNTFIGGRYSHNSAEGENLAGARHILLESTAHLINNNTWLNPSVEGNTVEQQIDVDGGCYNQWINPRFERSLGGRVRWGAKATQNLIQGGYNAGSATVVRVPGENRNAIQSPNLFELYGASGVAVTRLQNTAADFCPALALYGASSQADDAYRWRWSANQLEAKRVDQPHARLILDGTNGRYYLGNGTSAPRCFLAGAGTTGVSLNGGHFYFGSDGTNDIGGSRSLRPRDVNVARHVNVGGTLKVAGGVGFYGKPAAPKPTVKGSRGGNAALGSLISALATLGLITDKTTR